MTEQIARTPSAQGRGPAAADPAREAFAARRREWFARFAPERVMPLLQQAAAGLEQRGCRASARLRDSDGRLVAELEAVPPGLSAGARPPRLTVTASRPPRLANARASDDRPLLVEYTGTFPHLGATGGFGAEIGYDTVAPRQLAEQVLSFIELATGA